MFLRFHQNLRLDVLINYILIKRKSVVDLVWLNKTSLPNFSFLGSLKVAQIYFSGGGLVGRVAEITRIKANLSSAELG